MVKENDTMDYRGKIITFMQAKQDILTNQDIRYATRYFKELDRKDILKWSEYFARDVWVELHKNIFDRKVDNLFMSTCPFCLFYDLRGIIIVSKCTTCTYAINHGKCGEEYAERVSDWDYVTDNIGKPTLEILFSNDVYKDLYDKIEMGVNSEVNSLAEKKRLAYRALDLKHMGYHLIRNYIDALEEELKDQKIDGVV